MQILRLALIGAVSLLGSDIKSLSTAHTGMLTAKSDLVASH